MTKRGKILLFLIMTVILALPALAADLNGYTAQYECRAGNLNCDVDVNTIVNRPCDATITTADSISTINNKLDTTVDANNDDSIVICANAGDYRLIGIGQRYYNPQVIISVDGTARVWRVLRLTPRGDDPWNIPIAQQAIFRKIDVLGSYWIIHRLSFKTGGTFSSLLRIGENKDVGNIIADRIFLESGTFTNRGSKKIVTLQNSVLKRNFWQGRAGQDRQCVRGSGGNVDFHIVNNEVYDCGDNILLQSGGTPPAPGWYPGTVIENNDLYQTSYSYCDSDGTPNPNGLYSAGENAIDIKSGGVPNNILRVINNRMWGFKRTDTSCASTGSGGNAVITHGATRYTLIKNNIIFDTVGGFATPNSGTSKISLVGNVINSETTGMSNLRKSNDDEFYMNTFYDTPEWISSGGSGHDAQCNVLINAGTQSSGVQADNNVYYNTPGQLKNPGTNDLVFQSVSDAKNEDFCFYRKLRTNPELYCIPNLKPTTQSPHNNLCPNGVGSRTSKGIDDRIWKLDDTLLGGISTSPTPPPPSPTPPPPTPPPSPTPPPPSPTPPPPIPPPGTTSIPKTLTKPNIDGNLIDFAGAEKISFGVINGNTIDIWLMWDINNLYIGADIKDNNLQATLTTHDSNVWEDDGIEFVIDTLNDGGNPLRSDDYKILINVLGTVLDTKRWDPLWESNLQHIVNAQGTLNDASIDIGYSIEFSIPWTSFGISPSKGNIYGMNFANNDIDTTSNQYSWNGDINSADDALDVQLSGRTINSGSENPPKPLDLNNDKKINLQDLLIIVKNFKKANFELRADVNGDGVVDLFDLVMVAKYFGQTIS